jgi:hypothetical protein
MIFRIITRRVTISLEIISTIPAPQLLQPCIAVHLRHLKVEGLQLSIYFIFIGMLLVSDYFALYTIQLRNPGTQREVVIQP